MPSHFRPLLLAALLASTPAMILAADPAPAGDPYIWLEQVSSPEAQAWVQAENKRTLGVLESDPRFPALYAEGLKIVEATDRIPMPGQLAGQITNFWQDANHVHGIWRTTSVASYLTANPEWRTLIDLDALSAADKVGWVWKGGSCEPMAEHLCLVALSNGGEDATTLREFDLVKGAFVPGGFTLPTSKQDVSWETPDSILVSRDWGPGTMTTSGYAFVIKRLKRGQTLDQATEIFRGKPTDVGVSSNVMVDGQGNRLTLIERGTTTFENELYAVGPHAVTKLDLPLKQSVIGLVANRLVLLINQDWAGFTAGSLVAVRVVDGKVTTKELLFAPGPRQSVENATVTRDHVLAAIYDNVRGQAWTFTPGAKSWTSQRIALPDNASVDLDSSDRLTNEAWLAVQSFTVPSTLWRVDTAIGSAQQVKSMPARFDATNLVTEQFEATSKDGTKVPYFVVHRRGIKLDGSTPTLLNAYGGFQVSETPTYQATRGKLWLEKGGAYVLANIRGGGEFGPA